MVSLTLWPLAPWHAAHTVATLALPASRSAACANGETARATDNPSIFFMVSSFVQERKATPRTRPGQCRALPLLRARIEWIRGGSDPPGQPAGGTLSLQEITGLRDR